MNAFIQTSKIRFFVLAFIFAYCGLLSQNNSGGNKSALEEKRSKLNAEIEQLNLQVQQIKKNKKHSLSEIVALNLKIEKRNALLQNLSEQLSQLNTDMQQNKAEEQRLMGQYNRIKAIYIQSLLIAQKENKKFSYLGFVSHSGSFNQSVQRYKHLQQLSEIRKKQAELLKQTRLEINKTINVIHRQIGEKEKIKSTEEQEKQKLKIEKTNKEEVLSELQKKEKNIKKELDQKRKTALKLQNEIKRLIERELSKRKKPEKTNTGLKENKKAPLREILDANEIALGKEFISNKGILPWPVERGIVCERFGTHEHPAIKGFMMTNNGIELCVAEGVQARAVFSGAVTSIAASPSGGNLVIIRHGEFLSVYCNLDQITVKVGQHVKPRQLLGRIMFNAQENRSSMNFQIWKSQKTLNPEEWLNNTH